MNTIIPGHARTPLQRERAVTARSCGGSTHAQIYRGFLVASAAISVADISGAVADESSTVLKTEAFDRDPGWEGFNNRIIPKTIPTIVQDFGYSPSHFASINPGELGGRICRASEPAWYALKIHPKTLDDKLTASGTFAMTQCGSSSGICFGWFNGKQPSGMGRPMNSLSMMLGATKAGGRLALHVITAQNQVCAKFVTRFEPYRTRDERSEKRPTPIRSDGTPYHWKLDYDPAANNEKGQIQFSISSTRQPPDDFEGKIVTVDLPDGFKKQGTSFDHFGLINVTRPGSALKIYFGDLNENGHPLDLSKNPDWEGSGNRATYQANEVGGGQNFGYSATHFAGGTDGEIGGLIWRSPYAYYAVPLGKLSLNEPLEASGRFCLVSGAPDSGFYFGWFNSSTRGVDDQNPLKDRDFVGVAIGGPTRIGHYFLPAFSAAQGSKQHVKEGPILKPGTAYEWKLSYDPAANEGRGRIRATLGTETVTLDIDSRAKSPNATFDRFGIFTVGNGGGQAKAYWDDVRFTSGK